jgi:uncharacterized protein
LPQHRSATVLQEGITWNYTTWLNIAFLVLAAVLVVRFVRTGGIAMLRMMGGAPEAPHHDHTHHTEPTGQGAAAPGEPGAGSPRPA